VPCFPAMSRRVKSSNPPSRISLPPTEVGVPGPVIDGAVVGTATVVGAVVGTPPGTCPGKTKPPGVKPPPGTGPAGPGVKPPAVGIGACGAAGVVPTPARIRSTFG
jgi:hypothetical protein